LAVLTLIVLSLAILANSMTKPLGRDEQMYCTGGVLLAQGKMIYRDFSYIAQMPYHPLLYAALYKVLNTNYYLLVGRMFSSVCDILVVVCIVGIYRYIFKGFGISGALFGLAGAILYVFNPSVDYANGFAWNNDVVILCVAFSLWLFISTPARQARRGLTADFKQESQYWRIAGIGALLTLATCMRITTALVQLLFFIALLAKGPPSARSRQKADGELIKQRFKTVLPFLAASAVVLIWPVWLIAQAPRAFLLDVFLVQILNSEWLHKIGLVHDKFALIYNSLAEPGYLALIVIAVYLCVMVVWQRRPGFAGEASRKLAISDKADMALAALLPLAFFVIALGLPRIWRQHLAAPVPFLIIGAAYPLLYLRKLAPLERDLYPHPVKDLSLSGASFLTGLVHNRHFNIAAVLTALSVCIAVASYPVVLYRIPLLLGPQSWMAIELHKISEDIAEKTKDPKLILTLAPLYALEGGCDIYPEFSAGSFVYRVADFMTASDRAVTHSVGPSTLGELLEKTPPSAVILGVEMEFLEKGLFQAAVQPDRQKWEKKEYENGPIVYFRR